MQAQLVKCKHNLSYYMRQEVTLMTVAYMSFPHTHLTQRLSCQCYV